MIQEEGILDVRTAVVDLLANGQFGSDSSIVTKNDGGVKTPIPASNLVLTEKSVSGHQIKTKHVVPSTTANGLTFAEHEVNLTGGDSLTRSTFNSFAKTASVEVHAFTIFTINP